ncbi:hypothetical protein AQF98_21125 [Pedobacter sp. Hv1]|nr:hypothetical protein AQF98_21125 [Pedobacter sp. Hv1]
MAILCAMQSTFAQSIKVQQVVITGKVINTSTTTPKAIKANFFNPLKHNGLSVKLNDRYEFKVAEEMIFAQTMTVHYADYFIYLYVAPGDSVHLTIDATLLTKKDFSWLKITGDHGTISDQLNKANRYLDQLPYHKYDYSHSPAQLLLDFKEDYQRYLLALKDYAALHQLDPKAVELAASERKYGLANYISDYDNNDKAATIKLFGDAFFGKDDPKNFQSQMFPYYLADYLRRLTGADTTIAAATKAHQFLTAIQKGTKILLKETKGPSRDYMVYKYITSFLSQNPKLVDSIPNLKSYFTDELFYQELKNSALLLRDNTFPITPIKGIQYLDANNNPQSIPETDVFRYLAKRYPNKVIYIDVFATWCVPCRLEFQSTPSLHQSFADKDVVFVNLCLQSDVAAWQKMIKTEAIKGENYYLDNDATKLFMGIYRLDGYPTYILVKKDGKISTTRAPRPSQPALVHKAITQLL